MIVTHQRQPQVLGLIPAKGGSTRLPRKNIIPLAGIPLLTWSIQAARDSAICDRLLVSTEDEEIAALARENGAEVPFLRPDHLARDPAGVVDVTLHTLDMLAAQGEEYQIVVILLPTCPLRSAQDIQQAFALFQSRQALSLMSVSPFSHTPFAAWRMDAEGLLTPHFPEYAHKRSQELPLALRPNGAIHILSVAHLRNTRSYIAPPLLAYPMPIERSIDIDTLDDLRYAEALLANREEAATPPSQHAARP
ncbi:cytidylyltransferase domain-containing protein [Candidatus Magnetaquicoccus inordinatus]|uniref:acylneuraminate cytidylyltransferase family protein n=1 Tax=Candidatus Magnetaquicoccus inordinatus TaxID=2496818 RepID=UPI00102B6534|nr:acylneuraminate cytidylyltransferase family protein [Candidatus Magnetaquicoccus inordinatus]